MAIARYLVTQSGNDATTSVAMNLFPLDGKSGYEFTAIEVYWKNGESVAAADYEVYVAAQKVAGTLADRIYEEDWIMGVSWGQQNTAGVAVVDSLEPQKQQILIEPIVTVSQTLNVVCFSSSTAQANQVAVVVHYNVVKLTELEYLRLLAAGG